MLYSTSHRSINNVANDTTIGSITIKGIKTEAAGTKFTVNSILAALRFSKVTLKDIDAASGSSPWGVVADKISSFARTPKNTNDPKITAKSPDGTIITDGNFRLTLV